MANAQTQQLGAAGLQGQAHNATIVHKAACFRWGRWCPPGRRRVCGPYRCWCAPCWSARCCSPGPRPPAGGLAFSRAPCARQSRAAAAAVPRAW